MSRSEALPALPEVPAGWPSQGQWTYEDYCRLPDDGKHYEVIRGVLYMSPAPRTKHQAALSYLTWRVNNHVRTQKLGRVYAGPIDVILPGLASPVEPDLLFVDRGRVEIVKEKYLYGTPDLVMEILSPSNPSHDRKKKFDLYAEAGVREYWIVDLKARTIEVFALAEQRFELHGRFRDGDAAASKLLEGFEVPVTEVCDEA